MNVPTLELYKNKDIDLTKEYLEVAARTRYNNEGLEGNRWWERNLRRFFPIGDVNGTKLKGI